MDNIDDLESSFFSQIDTSMDAILEDEGNDSFSKYKGNPADTNDEIYGEAPDFAAIRKVERFEKNPFWVPRGILPGYWNVYLTTSRLLCDTQDLTRKKNIISGIQKVAKEKAAADRKRGKRIVAGKMVEFFSDMGVFIRLYGAGIDVLAKLDVPARRVLALYSLQLFGEHGKDVDYVINDYKTAVSYMKDYNWQKINPDNQEYLRRNGFDYPEEFKKLILFPDNFINPEKFKRGKQALASVKFQYVLKSSKKEFTAKLLYKTKTRKKYYINTEFLFNGNHWNISSNPYKESLRFKILESSWDDPDVSVNDYWLMRKSISVRLVRKQQLRQISFKKAKKYLSREKGVNNQWETGIGTSNTNFFEDQGKTSYSERASFIKIYQEGVYPIFSLGKNGMLVLVDIFQQMLASGHDKDWVAINYTDKHFLYEASKRDTENEDINRRQAFYKGVHECIEHSLICRGRNEGEYFINPLFFFHGNRKDI